LGILRYRYGQAVECEFTRDASEDKDGGFRLIRKAAKH